MKVSLRKFKAQVHGGVLEKFKVQVHEGVLEKVSGTSL